MKAKHFSGIVGLFVLGLLMLTPKISLALTSGPMTPEVATFATVGKTGESVDFATGDFNWGAPIINIPGRGNLDFPLSLQYTAGVKTDQEASWVGLGWNLNPGVIYRTTPYVPDDYSGGNVWTRIRGSGSSLNVGAFGLGYSSSQSGGNKSSGFSFSSAMSFFNIFGSFNIWKTRYDKDWPVYGFLHYENPASKGGWDGGEDGCGIECFRRELNPANTIGINYIIYYVPAPPMDTYVVSGPGPSGEMIPWRPNYTLVGNRPDGNNENDINGSAKFFFANHQGTSEDYQPLSNIANDSAVRIEHEFDAGGSISSFTIYDIDGTRYVYGQPALINGIGYHGQKDDDNYSKFGLSAPYAYAWHLTEILSADYVDSDGTTGPSEDDRGNWIKFTYTRSVANYGFSDPYEGWKEAPYIFENNQLTRSWGEKELWYLDKIITPTHEAHFLISDRLDARESNATWNSLGTAAGGTDHPLKLDTVNLYARANSNLTLAGMVDFTYDYSLRPGTVNSNATGGGTLTLKEVSKNDSTTNPEIYQFQYNGTNPTWGKNKWDQWGFYKFNGAWTVHGDPSNGDDAKAWSLTDIIYPTGGILHAEYESDVYQYVSTQYLGGGLRISSLTLNDGLGNETTTKYEYSTGKIGNTRPAPYESIIPTVTSHPFSSSDVHYSLVTEIPGYDSGNAPFGKTIVNFTTASDYHAYEDLTLDPDPYYGQAVLESPPGTWHIPEVAGRGHVAALYNRNYAWRVPKWVKVFNSSDEVIEQTDYTLVEDLPREALTFYNVLSTKDNHYYYVDFYLWGKLTVDSKTYKKLDVPVYSIYEYDPRTELVTLEEISDFSGNKKLIGVDYCAQGNACGDLESGAVGEVIEAKNILNLPYQSWIKENNLGNPYKTYNYNIYHVETDGESDYAKMRLYPRKNLSWLDDDADGQLDWGGEDSFIGEENLTFDAYGNVLTQKDPRDQVTTYTYDPLRYNALLKTSSKGGLATEFFYEDNRFYAPTKIVNADGTSGQFVYDDFGRLATKIATTGEQTDYTYHYVGSSISTSNLNTIQTDASIDGVTRTSVSSLDGLGRNVMGRSKKDALNWIITMQNFDDLGRPYQSSYPFVSSSIDYNQAWPDGYSRATYYDDPLARIYEAYPNYAASPSLKSTTSYAKDGPSSFLTTTIDPMGKFTKIYKHALGLETTYVRQNMHNYSQTAYADIFGHTIEMTDTDGKTTEFFYDTLGRKIASKNPDMDAFTSVSYPYLGQVTEEWVYDDAGNVVWYKDANLGHAATPTHLNQTYDSLGRNTDTGIYTDQMEYQLETWIGTYYNYVYNHHGMHQPTRTDAEMSNWQNTNDDKITHIQNDHQIEALFYDNDGFLGEKLVLSNGKVYSFKYYYNEAGEITSETIHPKIYDDPGIGIHDLVVEDATEIETYYTYNQLGQVEDVFLKKGTDPLVQVAHFTYKPSGQIDTLTRSVNNLTTTYGYDDLKRLNLIQNNNLQLSTYGFNRFFTHDDLGRITGIYNDTYANPEELIGNFNLGYPESYDNFGRLKSGIITSVVNPQKQIWLNYQHDNAGNRTDKSEFDYYQFSGIYDDDYSYFTGTSRLHQVGRDLDDDDINDETRTFSYDKNGNILSKLFEKTGQPNQTTSYVYDDYNNMIQLTLPNSAVETYDYAGSGKRIKKIDSQSREFVYIYDGNSVVFDRQLNGFVAGDTNGDRFVDIDDMVYLMAYIFTGGSAPEPLAIGDCDGSGGIDIDDIVYLQAYIFTGGPAPILPENLSLNTAYLDVNGIRLLSVSEGNLGNIKYYLSDQVGSASVIANSQGAEINRKEYYPFGNAFSSSGVYLSKYQYTGKELDDTTGLHYYGARFYDSDLGRFVAKDTVYDGPSPYAYANNNPLIAKDPTGNAVEGAAFDFDNRMIHFVDMDYLLVPRSSVLTEFKGRSCISHSFVLFGRPKGRKRFEKVLGHLILEETGNSKSIMINALNCEGRSSFNKYLALLQGTAELTKADYIHLNENAFDIVQYRRFGMKGKGIWHTMYYKVLTDKLGWSYRRDGGVLKKIHTWINPGKSGFSGGSPGGMLPKGPSYLKMIPFVGISAGLLSYGSEVFAGDYWAAGMDLFGLIPGMGDAMDLVRFGTSLIPEGAPLPAYYGRESGRFGDRYITQPDNTSVR
ncbi:MAG: RHS repeat-associated core domain-containing protein [Candidatus Omnitrophota bacterium]